MHSNGLKKIVNNGSNRQNIFRHSTSVNTNLAEAYCISTTSIPTVELLPSASAVKPSTFAIGVLHRLAAATAEAQ